MLGAVQVWHGAREIDLGGPLQRALLAMLLLDADRVVSRERLIDGLWGDEPPPRAGRSLETKASRLRAALGDRADLVARDGGYVLHVAPDEIDAHRFERALEDARSLRDDDPAEARSRLQAGLDLWHGEALSGLPDGALTVERGRLESARLEALEARIDADLALGRDPSLVGELQQLCSLHPARERFAEQLMLALYRSGRQSDALAAYRATHRYLRNELGLDPSPRLRELERAILRHDESLGPMTGRVRARLNLTSRRRRLTAAAAICGALIAAGALLDGFKDANPRPARPRPGLILVDAASGALRSDVAVAGAQGGLRFGYGHLWTMGENGVMAEVDPSAGSLLRSIPVGLVWGGLAVGAGGIWVSDRYGPTVVRIDPTTGQVNRRARLSERGLDRPEPSAGLAIAGGSLWVARGAEAVDRLDPDSLTLQRRIELRQHGCDSGGAQCAMATAGGHVWVVGGNGGWLARIDVRTDRVRIFHGLTPYVCCLAIGGGSVWVAEAHDIARLDLHGRVVHRYRFRSANIGDLAFDHGALWAAADTTGELLRIDAGTGRLTSLHVGGLLIAAAASHGIVAASALPLPADPTHSLGARALRVGLTSDWLNTTDPAVARGPRGTGRWQWQLDHAICGALYDHPDGADGGRLVPELADGPARQAAGGRTWTIPLRSGMRFSPPLHREVTARDVRATLLRALSPALGPAAPAARILRDVVGVAAYRTGRRRDVVGISIRNGALVIRTTRPVPDLPARLALPYFCILPAGTPTPPGGYQDPLPTAGPYYLAEHEGGVIAVVRPNPNYTGPRPRHLDGIVFHIDVGERAGVAQVRRGALDYVADRSAAAVSRRVGCRTPLAGVPGLNLAAACVTPG